MLLPDQPRTWLPITGSLEFDMPARKIGMSSVKNTGRFPTRKASSSQAFESLLERDFMTLLEYDTRVHSFAAQPITLRWVEADGTQRRYTPDVVVTYKPWLASRDPSLVTTLFEVKPREVLTNNWAEFKPRFKGATAWTKKMGYRFRIVTEKEIQTPYLENVRFLLRFRSDMPTDTASKHQQNLVLKTVQQLGTSTPWQLLERITPVPDQQAEFVPWIWYLINCNAIGCDLSLPLHMNSPIWSMLTEEFSI